MGKATGEDGEITSKNSPDVSIIVPIYNSERYLDECLSSLVNQTLKNIEIICIDDGSTDGTIEILKNFTKKYSRISIISRANKGYGATMNEGISVSRGKYIGIVESDDYVEQGMFEYLFRCAEENECDVVKSDYYTFSSYNKNRQTYCNTPISPNYYGKLLNHSVTKNVFHFRMNTWTGIYLTALIRNHNIRYNESPGASYQDNGFWFQTIAYAKRLMFVNKAFYHYRQDNPDSSINSKTKVYCMCDEYAHIEKCLFKDKSLENLIKIFQIKKFYNYLYNLNRIDDAYKNEFLDRFAEEFGPVVKNKIISEMDLGRKSYYILNMIVEDKDRYYRLYCYPATIHTATNITHKGIFERAICGDDSSIKTMKDLYHNSKLPELQQEEEWWGMLERERVE